MNNVVLSLNVCCQVLVGYALFFVGLCVCRHAKRAFGLVMNKVWLSQDMCSQSFLVGVLCCEVRVQLNLMCDDIVPFLRYLRCADSKNVPRAQKASKPSLLLTRPRKVGGHFFSSMVVVGSA